jgi:tetratricopeptide (TPR) repeat protein
VKAALAGGSRLAGEIAPGLLIVAAIWLGWQVVKEVGAERLPVGTAVRIAPSSASVLARAAEAEFAAKRYDNALSLAQDSLSRAPFNVRALRVVGLVRAEAGDLANAEEILTQAGNWSLRDDQAHGWLVERLLRKGDYRLAFAHADTLARRRPALWNRVFNLYRTAGEHDPRAFPALVSLLETQPPWRGEFLTYLSRSPEGLGVSANLAVALEKTDAPFSTAELSQLYMRLMNRRLLPAMKLIRNALGRPPVSPRVLDGSFSTAETTTPEPFSWQLPSASGVVSDILPDDIRPSETALRVQYDGYAVNKVADQFIQLEPGAYRLSGEARRESGELAGRLAWRVICFETDTIVAESLSAAWSSDAWTGFRADFVVPPTNCSAQWLRLEPVSANARSQMAVWYDRLAITPVSSSLPSG